jgi:energy-coupling factor transport system ATP-binding protein
MDIHIRDLTYTYNARSPFEQQVLSAVNMDVPGDSWVSVVGQTGSGKSTLVQHMNGLLRPTEGRVQVGDVTITSDRKKQKRLPPLYHLVGMVFQYPEHQLFEETVYKDIAYGPRNLELSAKEVDHRVLSALKDVGLEENLLERSPFDLSGGQKRRVAIAGVLAMQPQVLILDEPTAGLDPLGKEHMLDMFARWQERSSGSASGSPSGPASGSESEAASGSAGMGAGRKRSIVHITHHMEDVAQYADLVVVLQAGQVRLNTDPLALFTEYHHELQGLGLELPPAVRLFHAFNDRLTGRLTDRKADHKTDHKTDHMAHAKSDRTEVRERLTINSVRKEHVLEQLARFARQYRNNTPKSSTDHKSNDSTKSSTDHKSNDSIKSSSTYNSKVHEKWKAAEES